MRLYVVRHALAGHFGDPRWPDDSQRPLTDEGRSRFACLAAKLVEEGLRPQMVLTSPYVRCVQTAELLVEALERTPSLMALDALMPGSDAEAALTVTRQFTSDEIAWVGHAPDVSHLVAWLVSDPTQSPQKFSKGSVAAIRFPGGHLTPGGGELEWHKTCKSLGC